jgi:hypothetical protein
MGRRKVILSDGMTNVLRNAWNASVPERDALGTNGPKGTKKSK